MPVLASLNAKNRSKSPFSIGESFSIICEFTVDRSIHSIAPSPKMILQQKQLGLAPSASAADERLRAFWSCPRRTPRCSRCRPLYATPTRAPRAVAFRTTSFPRSRPRTCVSRGRKKHQFRRKACLMGMSSAGRRAPAPPSCWTSRNAAASFRWGESFWGAELATAGAVRKGVHGRPPPWTDTDPCVLWLSRCLQRFSSALRPAVHTPLAGPVGARHATLKASASHEPLFFFFLLVESARGS
eukprot:COSAG06_NODE_15_length_35009_cov_18.895417_16_plen_242_part_00